MKKIELLFLCVFCMNFIFGQDCEVIKDPITNARIVSFDYANHAVYYEFQDGKIKFELFTYYSGRFNVVMPKGTEVIFKLESNEILKFHTSIDAIPKWDVLGYSINTGYSYIFELNEEDIAKLAGSKAILFRYPDTNGGTIDMDLTTRGGYKRFAKAILNGATCIKSQMKL